MNHHHIDHEVYRFLEGMVGTISRPLLTIGAETLEKLLSRRPGLKVDITSPKTGIEDDVRRIQDLRYLGFKDEEIKPHIMSSATAKDSASPEKYACTAFDRATFLMNKEECLGRKEHKKELNKAKPKERELSL